MLWVDGGRAYPSHSSDFFHLPIDELSTLQEQFNDLMAMQALPDLLGLDRQLVDHRQSCLSRAASFGLTGVMPDSAKGELDNSIGT